MDFFISDTHFWHKNIIKYQRSEWCSTVEGMNEKIIDNWNSVVKKEDIVYHLGDFFFCGITKAIEILEQLNGHIKLVPGNHDDRKMMEKLQQMAYLEVLKPIHNYRREGQLTVLCHFPIDCWENQAHGSWHLHGHSHGSYNAKGKRIDVGIDVFNRPLDYEEIKFLMGQLPIKSNDYHGVKDEECY